MEFVMRIFTGNAHRELGNEICKHLGTELGRCEVNTFADGETSVKILDDIRGLHVFIIQPTCPPANQHLMELLIMVDALRRASAHKITAVIPYYGYARQDRKHAGRVPITAKLVANLLTTSGVDRVLCMDLHATQIQGFFDIPLDHLFSAPVIVDYLKAKEIDNPVVMSPDIGNIKMAYSFSKRLEGDLAVVEKRRLSDTEIEHGYVIGQIKDRDVIIVDDMIASAGSMASAVEIARNHGAKSVIVGASHGLFVGPAFERLKKAAPDEVIVTNTVPQREAPEGVNLTVLSVAPLLGEAINRIHRNKSVSLLFV
ncbi:MAG: ribose-phosphate pyrophosphokinase [Planctomycetes bacterium]|nr:ribose-phosphate pyrophosphokinase [Planctomycetota bacterium]